MILINRSILYTIICKDTSFMDPRNDRASSTNDRDAQRDAATKLVRDQLNALYDRQPRIVTPTRQELGRHHTQPHTQQTHQQNGHWQQYHSQWQDYYRQYYERYYVGKLHQAINEQPQSHTPKPSADEDKNPTDEVKELRAKIVQNAKQSAKKARKSRHFIPVVSAIVVMLVVGFLQYNQVIIGTVQAYVSPGAIDPQNIIVDPISGTRVSAEPRLIIPKINVDVPVIYGVGSDHKSQMDAMFKGVAHFAIPGANSVPGQKGNTVIAGHSSNDLFDPGDYKWIFVQLDKLKTGDTIYMHYESTRYTYTVTKKKVVKPTDVQALLGHEDKPYLTLITCTPIGTALNRLLVYAEQISPDPAKAKPASDATNTGGSTDMPGNGPSALQRLFGAR